LVGVVSNLPRLTSLSYRRLLRHTCRQHCLKFTKTSKTNQPGQSKQQLLRINALSPLSTCFGKNLYAFISQLFCRTSNKYNISTNLKATTWNSLTWEHITLFAFLYFIPPPFPYNQHIRLCDVRTFIITQWSPGPKNNILVSPSLASVTYFSPTLNTTLAVLMSGWITNAIIWIVMFRIPHVVSKWPLVSN